MSTPLPVEVAFIGNLDTEPDVMCSRSPLARGAHAQRPLLVVQTANDPRVTRAEAEQMVAAPEDNGIEHECVLIEGEGHGLASPEDRITAFDAVDPFIGQHDPATEEPR